MKRLPRILLPFFSAIFVSTLCGSALAQTQSQLIPSQDPFNQDATTLILGCDGDLSVNGGGIELTTMELLSSGEHFRPDGLRDPDILPGPFDVLTSDKLFKLDVDGFDNVNFGPVLPGGCNVEEMVADLIISGSYIGGGDLLSRGGGGPYLYTVPEPTGVALLGLGAIGLLLRRRRTR